MNIENKLEELRTKINAMSKKIIKLRHEYKSLKKLVQQEKEKTVPAKSIERNFKIKPLRNNFRNFEMYPYD